MTRIKVFMLKDELNDYKAGVLERNGFIVEKESDGWVITCIPEVWAKTEEVRKFLQLGI